MKQSYCHAPIHEAKSNETITMSCTNTWTCLVDLPQFAILMHGINILHKTGSQAVDDDDDKSAQDSVGAFKFTSINNSHALCNSVATFRPILRTICVSLHNAVEFALFKSAQTQSVYNIEFGRVTTASHFAPYASFNQVNLIPRVAQQQL